MLRGLGIASAIFFLGVGAVRADEAVEPAAAAEVPVEAPSPPVETPPPLDKCAATFPERLADAKRAWAEHTKAMLAYEKSGAAKRLEWFDAHCRILSKLEVAIRKLDDLNSFVCDPKAKGRPKGLTSTSLEEILAQPPALSELQGFRDENYRCLDKDKAERVGLVLHTLLTPIEQGEIACYGDERPMCVKARELIAKARAKGHR